MKAFSGIDYLKIDIANALGQDKLLFEDRITWFNNNIPELVVTMNNEELKEFIYSFQDVDSIELAYTGLLAYQDYWYKRPSGYRCQLDAVCSGASLMSALMADVKGLDHTGLISDRRGDLYSAVYNKFTELCKIPVKATRSDFKPLVMQFLYGSKNIIKETAMNILGYNHHRLSEVSMQEAKIIEEVMNCLTKAIMLEANGAYVLQQSMTKNWDANATKVEWILPDGFNVVSTNKIDKTFEMNYQGFNIQYSIKVEGTREKSVENCANLIHSTDGMIVRELSRRCSFDKAHLQQVLWYLNQVPDNVFELPTQANTKLDELVCLYEFSQFCTIRITEYIHSLADACKLSNQHRTKLISIIKMLLVQPTFDMVMIHDCATCLPNYMNYVRYWYKEIIADITESNMLVFLHNQFKNKISDPISKNFRTHIANQIRQSNYGLC